jgi:hypothetical protein
LLAFHQGNGVWVTNNGKRVQLRDVFLPSLTEVERVVLEKQAQEKILQLGITLTPQGSFRGIESFKFAIDVKRFFFSSSRQKQQVNLHRNRTNGEFYC